MIEGGDSVGLPEGQAPLITWPCYEPAGYQVRLTAADLQHLLTIGATGSGKTSLLIAACRQLIAHEAGNAPRKVGLLILDSKTELVAPVRWAAQSAGRPSDVVVLGPEGNASYDLFGPLRSLEDVETVTRRIMLAVPPLAGDNAYWQTATTSMLAAGLSLLVATQPTVTFDFALHFLRTWFLGARTIPKLVQEVAARAKQLITPARPGARMAQNHQLQGALDQVDLWQDLDPRTRSNLQSCLVNVLRPLMTNTAARCFGQGGLPAFDPGEAARDGLVCVASANALTQPELARFLFRLARQSFFDAVQRRIGTGHRFCGLIADEFPLVVCREDAEQLATVRSKGCFVLAATQGLAGIDNQIGERARRAVLQHFNTLVFLRSMEEEAGLFATLVLGTRQVRAGRRPTLGADGWLATEAPSSVPSMPVPVCEPGALSRLAAHQAYVLLRDGSRTESPIWFAPWFELDRRPVPAAAAGAAAQPGPPGADHLRLVMAQAGYRVLCSAEVVQAAFDLCRPKERKGRLFMRVARFFKT
ncbi:MAG: TraM recognition domain-containing protein, partial [Verrucomicrobiota bacterium]